MIYIIFDKEQILETKVSYRKKKNIISCDSQNRWDISENMQVIFKINNLGYVVNHQFKFCFRYINNFKKITGYQKKINIILSRLG